MVSNETGYSTWEMFACMASDNSGCEAQGDLINDVSFVPICSLDRSSVPFVMGCNSIDLPESTRN